MYVSYCVYSVSHINSFVIVRREGNFINICDKTPMTMTSSDIHFSTLFLPAKQALSIVIKFNIIFTTFFDTLPPTFFILRAIKHFVGVKFSSQSNNFNNCLPPASSLNIPSTLLLSSVLIPDG